MHEPFTDLVRDGTLKAVSAAIDAGAAIDAPDDRGFTPLMIACGQGHEAIARLLILRGARLDVAALALAMVRCPRIAETLVALGVLGRPLATPAAGTLLLPACCDVCTRYPDLIEPNAIAPHRFSGSPAEPAWLDVISEKRSSEGKTDVVERTLRCPFCGTCYDQRYSHELETVGVTLPVVSESIRRCSPSNLPVALLGALFVAEDGKLACQIVCSKDPPFLTTVWSGISGAVLLPSVHTTWRPGKDPRAEYPGDRLGQMQSELGIVGAGNLYSFYVVRKNPDHAIYGDKEWIAALPDTPLADLRLFPEYGSSPYMPDDWDWQDGWWYPYSTYRPATPSELAAHAARR